MPFYSSSIVAIATQKTTNCLGNVYLYLAYFPGGVFIFVLANHCFHNNVFICGFQLILFGNFVIFFNYIKSSANIYVITSFQHFISLLWSSTGYMLTFSVGVLWHLTSVLYSCSLHLFRTFTFVYSSFRSIFQFINFLFSCYLTSQFK